MSDHELTILVNDTACEVPRGAYTGKQIKDIAHVAADHVLYHKTGTELRAIGDEETIEIHQHEEFVSAPPAEHSVTIFINERAYELRRGSYTGAQLKAVGGVPSGDVLYHIKGHDRIEIDNAHPIEIHNDERFISVPPIGGAG